MAFIISFFLKKFEKIEKIVYHSNFECNTERGFEESLSIALGVFQLNTGHNSLTLLGMREDTFHPLVLLGSDCLLNFYQKFPNFFGGEN